MTLIALGLLAYLGFACAVGRFLRSVLSEAAGELPPRSSGARSIPKVRCDLPPSVALPAVSGTREDARMRRGRGVDASAVTPGRRA